MPPGPAGPPHDGARRELSERASRDERSREEREMNRLLAPVIASAGYDLEDLTVAQAGRRRLVRVIVDADEGIDLDAVAQVSRAVSDALDARDAFEAPYVLEVSSPGVDRPLREPKHWRRATGRLVKVDVDGNPLVGRVLAANPDGVRLDVDGTPRAVAWSALGPGRIQVEFHRPDADGEAAGAVDDGDATPEPDAEAGQERE